MMDALKLAECIGNINAVNDHDGSSTKSAVSIYQEEMLRRSQATVRKNVDASSLNLSSMGWGGRDVQPLEWESISLEEIGRVQIAPA